MDRTALVFGGTGGIGRMVAAHLAECGFGVTVAARSPGQDRSVFAISADIAERAQVVGAFDRHCEKWGTEASVVVNAAAIQGPIGPFWKVDDAHWEQTVQIDLVGSFRVLAEATRRMEQQQQGKILLFSGGGAVSARPNFSAYAAVKAGLLRLVENAADELRGAGLPDIHVFAVAPGAVRSRMTGEILVAGERAGDAAAREALITMQGGGTDTALITRLLDFLIDGDCAALSGRLIHVREEYLAYGGKRLDEMSPDIGKLRRIPL